MTHSPETLAALRKVKAWLECIETGNAILRGRVAWLQGGIRHFYTYRTPVFRHDTRATWVSPAAGASMHLAGRRLDRVSSGYLMRRRGAAKQAMSVSMGAHAAGVRRCRILVRDDPLGWLILCDQSALVFGRGFIGWDQGVLRRGLHGLTLPAIRLAPPPSCNSSAGHAVCTA